MSDSGDLTRKRDLYFRRMTEATEAEGFVNIHDPRLCLGDFCVFHAPSDHHMRAWEKTIRTDKDGLIERLCSHRVGHPDPDSLAYFTRQGVDHGTHGCDGCCQVPNNIEA